MRNEQEWTAGMNEDSKLRECPFCGGEAEAWCDGDKWDVRCAAGLACYSPRPQSPGWHYLDDAIAAWNARIPTLTEDQKVAIARLAADRLTQHERDKRRSDDLFIEVHDIILSAINEVCAQPVLFLEERR